MSTFPNNIQIAKKDPAVQYEPNPASEPLGVWHEDHEINGVMYRATNAKFDDVTSFKWSLSIGSQPAYCITQNIDGSTSYMYMAPNSVPWNTSDWVGTGQPVMYHAVNYGLNENDLAGAINQAALQAAVNAAFETGGIVFIPAGNYQINGTVSFDFTSIPGTDNGIIITGAGGNTELIQNADTNTFSLTGLHGGRGVRFEDLRMSNTNNAVIPPDPGYSNGSAAAIYVSDCQNVTCERVYFDACLQSIFIDNQSEQCGLYNCTVYYHNASAATMIYLGGSENYVQDCDISQPGIAKGGPLLCTAIVVNPAGGAVYVGNSHLS
ncbi:MAG TPA: hypothetical protein VIY68_12335, partial [Steroidobacteraceae bacterium]